MRPRAFIGVSAGRNGRGRAGMLSKLRIMCLNNFSRLQVIRLSGWSLVVPYLALG